MLESFILLSAGLAHFRATDKLVNLAARSGIYLTPQERFNEARHRGAPLFCQSLRSSMNFWIHGDGNTRLHGYIL